MKRGKLSLIEAKDVFSLRIPYSDPNSELASIAHMFICISSNEKELELIKCQPFKPYHRTLDSKPSNRIVEKSNSTRNPFRHSMNVIDLDKIFVVNSSSVPEKIKYSKGISDDLLKDILDKVNNGAAEKIVLDSAELKMVNPHKL
jgi:hypothetical protein